MEGGSGGGSKDGESKTTCLIHRAAAGAARRFMQTEGVRLARRWKEVWPVLSITFVVCVAPSSGGRGQAEPADRINRARTERSRRSWRRDC